MDKSKRSHRVDNIASQKVKIIGGVTNMYQKVQKEDFFFFGKFKNPG